LMSKGMGIGDTQSSTRNLSMYKITSIYKSMSLPPPLVTRTFSFSTLLLMTLCWSHLKKPVESLRTVCLKLILQLWRSSPWLPTQPFLLHQCESSVCIHSFLPPQLLHSHGKNITQVNHRNLNLLNEVAQGKKILHHKKRVKELLILLGLFRGSQQFACKHRT
jgi:hypothetical protein